LTVLAKKLASARSARARPGRETLPQIG
jgi:hypothetical protein